MQTTIVAGIGNIFLGDDGFGIEVVQRLNERALPPHVKVADFGIRGLHLAFELLEHEYETVMLVDATPRGGQPGDVYLIEASAPTDSSTPVEAHAMTPDGVLSLLASLGGKMNRVLVVGCEPQCIEEGIGLSPAVAASVDAAIDLVMTTIDSLPAACGPLPTDKEPQDVPRDTRADCSVR